MQTDRREDRINKKEKHKKRIMAAKPNIILSLVVATIVTLISWYKVTFRNLPIADGVTSVSGWALFGIYGGIFTFAFGITFLMNNWTRYKNKFRASKHTIFIILSLIMSGLATWASKGTWINFIIGLGMCLAVFEIFYRFDYAKIKQNFIQLVKSFAYGVIFPSMFLIIALMGVIDNENTFMNNVTPSLIKAGDAFTNGFISIVQQIYDLGKYEYSLQFIIAAFIFLIFFATYDFFKKTKPIFYEHKGKKVEVE